MGAAVTPEQLRRLLELSRTLAVTLDLQHLLPEAARVACQIVDCERASVFFHDEPSGTLCTRVAIDADPICVPLGRGFVGRVFETGVPLLVPDAYADETFNPDNDRRTGFKTRDVLTVPMLDLAGKPVGVVQALNSRAGFSQTDLDLLGLVADQTGVAVQRHRLSQRVLADAAVRKEMEIAAAVQTELLPKTVPQVGTLDVAGWSTPASITGGDCYDLWKLEDGRLAVFVADAAGHGMAPAMVVSQARSLVRALTDCGQTPADVLNRVNVRMAEDFPPSRFVTAVLAYVSADGRIEMASAGHAPLLHSPEAGRPYDALDASGLPLAVLDVPNVEPFDPLTLGPGGELVLLTDGIFEARNPDDQLLEIERVQAALSAADGRTAAAQIGVLRDLVTGWSAGGELLDDQTVVVVRVPG